MSLKYDKKRGTAHPADVLRERFQRHVVATLPDLSRSLRASGRTVFRVLSQVGYHSSYSHTGRYYTLEGIPTFDADGLWFHEDVGFSVLGTLRATVETFVKQASSGCTHEELQGRLRARVHDLLRTLVHARLIGRERVDAVYVYVSASADVARAQLAHRRALRPPTAPSSPPLNAAQVIDVLLAVIRSPRASAKEVGTRLRARGLAVSDTQVQDVFVRYDLEKKTAHSRSRRSRR